MTFFIDTHAHLVSLVTAKGLEADALCKEMQNAGVSACFNVLLSEKEASARHLFDVPFREHGITLRHIAGVHPHDASTWNEDDRWICASRFISSRKSTRPGAVK